MSRSADSQTSCDNKMFVSKLASYHGKLACRDVLCVIFEVSINLKNI